MIEMQYINPPSDGETKMENIVTWSIYENMEGQEIEVDGCILPVMHLRADNFETEEKAEDAMMQMIPAFGGELILQEIYI